MKKIKTSAFTLIELLVVIVIIGILATIGIGTFNGYKDKAQKAKNAALASQVKKAIIAGNVESEGQIIGYFTFDDDDHVNTTSPFIIDESGLGNNIIAEDNNNTSAFSQSDDSPFPNGKSLRLESNPWLKSASPINGASDDTFTVSFFFKLNNYESGDEPYFFWTNDGIRIRMKKNTNQLEFRPIDSQGFTIESPADSIEVGKWHHVIASFDRDPGDDSCYIELWLDGEKVDSLSYTSPSTTGSFDEIFFSFDLSSRDVDGWIDEFIYATGAFNGEFLE